MRTSRSLAQRLASTIAVSATVAALGTVGLPAGSANAAGVTLLYGRVTDGGPVNGATILAQVWPNDSYLSTQADETTVPVIDVTTTTDASGNYTVSLDPSTVSSDYATSGGYVNVTLTAVKGTQKWATFSTTVIKQLSTWATPDAGSTPQIDLDLASATAYDYNLANVPSEDAAGNVTPSSATQSLQVVDVASNGGFTPNVGCVTLASGSWQYSKPQLWLRANGWWGATMTVDLNLGSAHSMGIAVTTNGSTWSQSGSATIETKTESGANVADVYDVYIYNKVNYRRYYNSCYPKSQFWRVVSFADLISNDLMYYSGHKSYSGLCQFKDQGNYWKARGSNTTYSSGVTLNNISLSSHASFASNTREAWYVQTGRDTRLCGSGSQGWPTDALADGRPW